MNEFDNAKQTVAGFFNAHARGDRAGNPALFVTDVNGTLDRLDITDALNQFLIDVLDMNVRLQVVATDVKIMSSGPIQNVRQLPHSLVQRLKDDADWFVDKGKLATLNHNLDVGFDDHADIREVLKELGAVAVLDPAGEECKGLLSAWAKLGENDAGKEVQNQVFRVWYHGETCSL